MDALDAGAHVIVEKPATSTFEELETLVRRAQEVGRHLVEDYNYVFNRAPQEILRRIESGEFGAVTHVEVLICLDILGPSGFADPNAPHPALTLAGGAIADFLPHLASLAHALRRAAPDRPDGLDQAQAVAPAVRRVPRRGGRGAWDRGPGLQRQLAAGRLLAAGLRGADAGHRQPLRDAAHLRRPPQRAQAAAPLLQRPGGGEDHPARRARPRCSASSRAPGPTRGCGSSWPAPTGRWPTGRPCRSRRATSSR